MVLGTPTMGMPFSKKRWAIFIEPSPPIEMIASRSTSRMWVMTRSETSVSISLPLSLVTT